jgi:hypothetical protein
MGIEREEYNHGQQRIHERIDKIAKSTAEISTYSKAMKESSDRIFQAVYGNGKDGLIQKITKVSERSSLHTKLIIAIIVALFGIASYVIKVNLGA